MVANLKRKCRYTKHYFWILGRFMNTNDKDTQGIGIGLAVVCIKDTISLTDESIVRLIATAKLTDRSHEWKTNEINYVMFHTIDDGTDNAIEKLYPHGFMPDGGGPSGSISEKAKECVTKHIADFLQQAT
eukprot:CAMPEP_0170760386 /NCGR_PEP_ID=MMETSP0733-20121128/1524_1 /TAXON_ID=186038 /ORGANISM="Fragilariopsis kerguelensis, Strain L26-C5" /LENGTH=129 /DNA_ID=CAMNT_0011100127 /DNA_START=50 /DNA_END=436 /DNA_ORIENTATION=-